MLSLKPIYKPNREHILKRIAMATLKHWLVVLLALVAVSVGAQDIHLSQYYYTPLQLNPAMAGVHTGDYRFAASYRGQWYSALVPYTTFVASADRKFYPRRQKKIFYGAGISLLYDQAGDAILNNVQVGLNGSITYAIDKENYLTGGLMIGGNQRTFQPDRLTFDYQYIDGAFDPDRPINEDFISTRNLFGTVGLGINYHGQQAKKRNMLDAGIGLFHLNRPNQSFREDVPSELPMRLSLYILPQVQLHRRLDLVLASTAQFQGAYVEALAGGGLRFFPSLKRSRELAVQLGLAYRFNSFGDSFIPGIELHYGGLLVGFSYDVNISDFQEATNRNGGPELTVRYILAQVKPLNAFRMCRLY